MSLVTIRVRVEDARGALEGDRLGYQHLLKATTAALEQLAQKTERKIVRKRALKLPTPAPKKSEAWPTLKLRKAVWERSEGRCENPRCRRRIRWHTFDLDHFLGRGKAEQSPENTWALCSHKTGLGGCHHRKHAGDPTRAWWLEAWLEFARPRFAGCETVALVEGQLQAERAGAELDAMRRQRVGEVAGG